MHTITFTLNNVRITASTTEHTAKWAIKYEPRSAAESPSLKFADLDPCVEKLYTGLKACVAKLTSCALSPDHCKRASAPRLEAVCGGKRHRVAYQLLPRYYTLA
jgi:hypothetical protein